MPGEGYFCGKHERFVQPGETCTYCTEDPVAVIEARIGPKPGTSAAEQLGDLNERWDDGGPPLKDALEQIQRRPPTFLDLAKSLDKEESKAIKAYLAAPRNPFLEDKPYGESPGAAALADARALAGMEGRLRGVDLAHGKNSTHAMLAVLTRGGGARIICPLWPGEPPLSMPDLIKVTDTPNKDFVIVHPDRHPLIVRVEDAVTHPPEVHGSLIESPKVKVHDEADVAHGEYRLNLKFALPLPSPDYYTMLSRMILRDLMLKMPKLESQRWASPLPDVSMGRLAPPPATRAEEIAKAYSDDERALKRLLVDCQGNPAIAYKYLAKNSCTLWRGTDIRCGLWMMNELWKRMSMEQKHALPTVLDEHYKSLQPLTATEIVERNKPEPPAPRMWPVASRRAALEPNWPPPRPPCPHFINRAPQVYGSTGPTFLAEVTVDECPTCLLERITKLREGLRVAIDVLASSRLASDWVSTMDCLNDLLNDDMRKRLPR